MSSLRLCSIPRCVLMLAYRAVPVRFLFSLYVMCWWVRASLYFLARPKSMMYTKLPFFPRPLQFKKWGKLSIWIGVYIHMTNDPLKPYLNQDLWDLKWPIIVSFIWIISKNRLALGSSQKQLVSSFSFDFFQRVVHCIEISFTFFWMTYCMWYQVSDSKDKIWLL